MSHQETLTGGCLCGAVRYEATGTPALSAICHCRMCQRAGGGPFMAFMRHAAADVAWSGQPAIFKSSNFVERGFCAACGTPLTYQMKGADRVSVTIASLDDPAEVAPRAQLGVEARIPWVEALASLPEHYTDDWLRKAKIADVGNRQHPDHET